MTETKIEDIKKVFAQLDKGQLFVFLNMFVLGWQFCEKTHLITDIADSEA